MKINSQDLLLFVTESNHIENIKRPPTKKELAATEKFLTLETVAVDDLKELVATLQPYAVIRDRPGMDVRVGNHVPLGGGNHIPKQLQLILDDANADSDPYGIHVQYETLHPFMDGNGRSGRALWAWQMLRQDLWPRLKLGFLHAWYYQSLQQTRR